MVKHDTIYTPLLALYGLFYLGVGLYAWFCFEPSRDRTIGVSFFVAVFVMTLCVFILRLRESKYARIATRVMNILCLLLIAGIPLGIYGLLKVDRKQNSELLGREESGHDAYAVKEVRRHGLRWVTSFCAPSILGAAIVQIALAFAPVRSNPISAPMHNLWMSGVWLIVIGKLFLLVGLFLGIRLIYIDRARSRQSLLCILIMALGLAAGIYGWMLTDMLREVIKDI